MPQLTVSVSTTSPPTSSSSKVVTVNSSTPTHVKSDHFEGDVLVRIKDYKNAPANEASDAYFASKERTGKTWSIWVKGTFADEIDGDDLVFGNVFEKPIRDSLPWGTSVALKFMHFVDPTMDTDVYADKPWALSPLLATSPFLSFGPHPSSGSTTTFDASKDLKPLKEDSLEGLVENLKRSGNDGGEGMGELEEALDQGLAWPEGKRKAWVGVKENREAVKVTKQDVVAFDFVAGYIDFNTLSVSLPSVGFNMDLLKYWDGQPLTFVCRNRSGSKTFFAVSFEITDPDIKPAVGDGAKEGAAAAATPPPKKEEEVEISDEVD